MTSDLARASSGTQPGRSGDVAATSPVAHVRLVEAPPQSRHAASRLTGQEVSERPAGIVGQSAAIRRALAEVERVAPARSTVMLLGETGSGKELFANALHELSPRRSGPLVKVNCAAISPTLVESELFGHEKGAFTGALQRRIGRFEQAQGGTLFLDEIGELPADAQAKLLRVLQERELERVGGGKPVPLDVRIICATNRNLEAEVAQERFRPDLFYRLNVFPIHVPPLRDRREDIPLLVHAFVRAIGDELGRALSVDDVSLALLCEYDWPGNVRELRNVLERAAIVARGPAIAPEDLPPLRGVLAASKPGTVAVAACGIPANAAATLKERVNSFERSIIEDALRRSDGNQSEAARRLRVSRATLLYKLKAFALESERRDDPERPCGANRYSRISPRSGTDS